MSNYDYENQGNDTFYVVAACALAGIVGLLILIQLFRAQPMDIPSMLIIAVCFVVSVVTTAMWGKKAGR